MDLYRVVPLEEGTIVYCVICYPSGIHRVQKLIAGDNGVFYKRPDGSIYFQGGQAYLDYNDALDEAREENHKEVVSNIKTAEWFRERANIIYKYLHGIPLE